MGASIVRYTSNWRLTPDITVKWKQCVYKPISKKVIRVIGQVIPRPKCNVDITSPIRSQLLCCIILNPTTILQLGVY
jgi:hypothetical protein